MSKVKNPKEKKSLSLKRDRRNVYGENSKSSRKNIARAKQRRHMDERRSASHLLSQLHGQVEDDAASETEVKVKLAIRDCKNRGFKKIADKPLGEVIQRKMGGQRWKRILRW